MIWRNLQVRMDWVGQRARGIESYLLPLLFVGTFVPGIIRNWPRADRRLRALAVSITPLVVVSSLCFSWLREARNYMPLIPLLGSAAISPGTQVSATHVSIWLQRVIAELRKTRRFKVPSIAGVNEKPQSSAF
jgi:hypothetical protein